MRKRIGVFGWGVVAPKSPDIAAFERNLSSAASWLEPFDGFGPSNFLVGRPEFDFEVYRSWIDERFEPRRFSQLTAKMGNTVKYAIGAFVQALGQNPGLEPLLKELGPQAHIYVGTALGDFPLHFEHAIRYHRAQRRWNRFWCRDEQHGELRAYRVADDDEKRRIREQVDAPQDPSHVDPLGDDYDEISERWETFWVARSEGLRGYLDKQIEIEHEGIIGDIDSGKKNVIRHKVTTRRKLNSEYGCPTEPWNAVDPNLLWNIPNIPAAQISMLAHITGTTIAPIAACSGFSVSLKMAIDAIQSDQAKVAVIGMTDPEPHAMSVGTFFGARVLSHDGQVSKPFTGFRGTHVAGGSCIWIVGDADYLTERGFKPLGLEVLSVAVSSDADHIITPSQEGPRRAIQQALDEAGIAPSEVATWDMHATATPGDWNELQNILSVIPETTAFTARKGSFGHGMSVCGGWELTAQHLGFSNGELHPVNLTDGEIHNQIRSSTNGLVQDQARPMSGDVAGKINMGVGGINACVICRKW